MKLSESDVEFEHTRSGGPGGQHANSRATAVRLRVPVDELPLEDDEKKIVVRHMPPRYMTKANEIIIENCESRSRALNREQALELANRELEKALEQGRQKRRKKERKNRISRGSGGGGSEDIKEKQKKRRRAETTDDLLEQAFEADPQLRRDYLETGD